MTRRWDGNQEQSSEQWEAALESGIAEAATAFGRYRETRTPDRLAAALGAFVRYETMLFVRRPQGISAEQSRSHEDSFARAADLLVQNLIDNPEARVQFSVPSELPPNSWIERTKLHALGEKDASESLTALPSDSGTSSQAVIGAAHVIRLGQLVFSRAPQEFRANAEALANVQALYLEAASDYLSQVLALSSEETARGVEVPEPIAIGEEHDVVELPQEIEEALGQISMGIQSDWGYHHQWGRSLDQVRATLGQLPHRQKEEFLWRMYQPEQGLLWRELSAATAKGRRLADIHIPELFGSLAIDAPVDPRVLREAARFVFAPEGVIGSGSRRGGAVISLVGAHEMVPTLAGANLDQFTREAVGYYRNLLEHFRGIDEPEKPLVEHLWHMESLTKEAPASLSGPLWVEYKRALPSFLPQVIRGNTFYGGMEALNRLLFIQGVEFSGEEFAPVFDAWAAAKFGFGLLLAPETAGKPRYGSDDEGRYLYELTKDGGILGEKAFGAQLTEHQKIRFFEAVSGTGAFWKPDGAIENWTVRSAIQQLDFFDHVAWEKERKKLGYLADQNKRFDDGYCSRNALGSEIKRRNALLERELMINLAMSGDLPVRDRVIDQLVESQEIREVVEQLRARAKELIGSWRQEAGIELLPVGEDERSQQERLFFGRDHLVAGCLLRLEHAAASLGVPAVLFQGLGGAIADRILVAGHDAQSRERLMADVAFVREKQPGDVAQLLLRGEIRPQFGDSSDTAFLFTELLADEKEFHLIGDEQTDVFGELRRLVESLGGAPTDSLLAGIRERVSVFLKMPLATQLEQALAASDRTEYAGAQRIFGLLRNKQVEPIRDAIRDLVMLKMFALADPAFGAGAITLTDGSRGYDRVFPPLLIGSSEQVTPYSLGNEAAWTIVVGPNGGGKTNFITALTAAESLGIAGVPPFAQEVRFPHDASHIPALVIGEQTTTAVSRFDSSVRAVNEADRRLAGCPSLALDEPFAGTGARFRGHLQAALALKALALGKPVRLTTHQTETVYADTALLGIAGSLDALGLSGAIQWLSVDSQHRTAFGRVTPFGIEMATGAGYPTVVAENAKRLRDAFPSNAPVALERIAGNERDPKPLPQWTDQETLLRLGINGRWGTGLFYEETTLPKGEGDVLKYLFGPFDREAMSIRTQHPTYSSREDLYRYCDQAWFVRSFTRFIQRHDSPGEWQERQNGLRRYASENKSTSLDLEAHWEYASLVDRLGVVSILDDGYDREKAFFTSDPRIGHTDWDISRSKPEDIRYGCYAARFDTFRAIRKGKTSARKEVASATEVLRTVNDVSGVSWSVPEVFDRLTEGLEAVFSAHRAAAGETFARAVASEAIKSIASSWKDFSNNPGARVFTEKVKEMGYLGKDFSFSGTGLKYFLPQQLRAGAVAPVLSLVAEFGRNHLGGEERKFVDTLFDGTLERELGEFGPWKLWQKKQKEPLTHAQVVERLSAGDATEFVAFLDWLETLPGTQQEQYRPQAPATMGLLYLYQRTMDWDMASRWEGTLRGDLNKVREQAIEVYERTNLNIVLSQFFRHSAETHATFTEASERDEVILQGVYNPGVLQADIVEVPQSLDLSETPVAVISGPNTGGKTSFGKKLMVSLALHKAMGIGVGERIRLPKPDVIGGMYASINAAETREGEGNLASEARDVGRFLGEYLTAGCPAGAWLFIDEGFSGTGQADQAGLGTAAAHLVADHGGRVIVTTNEEGLIQGLDQAGVSHRDIRFVYGDPEDRYRPQPGVGGAESFRIAADLGLDPRVVELGELLDRAYQELQERKRVR